MGAGQCISPVRPRNRVTYWRSRASIRNYLQRSRYPVPSFWRDASRASFTLRWWVLGSLVVTNISSRGTPDALIPIPTSVSFPYSYAVSIWRYPGKGACDQWRGGRLRAIAFMLTDPKRGLNSLFDLPGGALPGAQADNGHVCTCVEPYGLCSGH